MILILPHQSILILIRIKENLMIVGLPQGMTRLSCKKCGFANLVPEKEHKKPPSEPGSYYIALKASPTCVRCMNVLS